MQAEAVDPVNRGRGFVSQATLKAQARWSFGCPRQLHSDKPQASDVERHSSAVQRARTAFDRPHSIVARIATLVTWPLVVQHSDTVLMLVPCVPCRHFERLGLAGIEGGRRRNTAANRDDRGVKPSLGVEKGVHQCQGCGGSVGEHVLSGVAPLHTQLSTAKNVVKVLQ